MRNAENADELLLIAPATPTRSLKTLGLRMACVVGIGLCLAGTACAGDDDEEDDTPFEDKIIRNIMSGIGGTNMDNKGIDYRERSPLVVPRSTDLPPPATGNAAANSPNWPKDPSVAARKAAADSNKGKKAEDYELSRTLTPAELAPKKKTVARTATPQQPGTTDAYGGNGGGPMLLPSQLGFNTGILSGIFKGNSAETGQFKGEPSRESLTQPPVGYQTPSPDYAYGTGPATPIDQRGENPLDPKQQRLAR